MKTILVCLQHALTSIQMDSLKNYGFDILYLKDEEPELFKKVSNCPSDMGEIMTLASEFCRETKFYDALLLPIGSPAFMFRVAEYIETDYIFAHSERVSEDIVEPDGSIKKVSKFLHSHFMGVIENEFVKF